MPSLEEAARKAASGEAATARAEAEAARAEAAAAAEGAAAAERTPTSLPDGWEERWDDAQGAAYYLELSTGYSQWERPQAEQHEQQQGRDPPAQEPQQAHAEAPASAEAPSEGASAVPESLFAAEGPPADGAAGGAAGGEAGGAADDGGAALREALHEVSSLQAQLSSLRSAAAQTASAQESEIEELRAALAAAQSSTPMIGSADEPGSPRGTDEQELATRVAALERAAAALDEEREELQQTARAAARREANRAATSELIAMELAELQAVVAGSEPPGPALLRVARERQQALAQLVPMQRRVAELEEDLKDHADELRRLKIRNKNLMERERQRRGALPAPGG